MDERQARIQEDLRGLVRGEVRCDDIYVQLYASDASLYQVRPLGVVMPRSTADVVATVQYAAEHQIPIHARGAGTGLAGESLGPGLVIDFSRYLRRVLSLDDHTVRVQPGVVLARLNDYLRTLGRVFGPDPANRQVTTMGSVIAIDAGGSRWLRYGSARSHVVSLEVVLADGTLLEIGREPLIPPFEAPVDDRRRALVDPLADLLERQAALIETHQPRSRVNRAGYHLAGILGDDDLDLAALVCGSEGTLALLTEATLATDPLPRQRGLAMLFFDRLEAASRAALEILPFGPSACDLMDRRHLSLARETEVRYDLLIPARAEALLLVEHEAADQGEVRRLLEKTVQQVTGAGRLAFEARLALDREDYDLFWQLSRRVTPNLHRLRGSTRPLPFVEDVAVPPDELPGFLVRLQNVLKQHEVIASLFAHAGQGQLHLRPFLDTRDPADLRRMEPLARDLYEAVLDVGGTISGEHGAGYSRTPFLKEQYGPLYDVFREVKRIFDPANILNPGKIVGDEPHSLTDHLRPSEAVIERPVEPADDDEAAPAVVPLQMRWTPAEFAATARSCNGCGVCRSMEPDVRMCPIFRFAPGEDASPRAKANLVRALLSGQLEPTVVATDEFKAVADLCVNCQMCRLECPSNVDIPRLMVEAKAAYVATNGLRVRDWVLARLDVLSAWGSRLGPLANWLIANRQSRWVLEKLIGIAQGRKLPRYTRRTFLRRAARRRLTRVQRGTGPKVLYFVDTYANYHDPQLAEALVAILEHNGVDVYVHPGQLPSGMSMISSGMLDAARRTAAANVHLLAEAVRQGYTIVASEPAAALCLTYEYPLLLDDTETRHVAENSSEACAYLWALHRQGRLQLDFEPLIATVGYHVPCHMKALGVGEPGYNLLRLIPALTVERIDKGCSGMAGTFGMQRENFRNSLRAGWNMITALRHASLQVGTTECSACKIQMEQGANKPTIHPLKLLALSYGLMPEIASLLTARTEELVVT